MTVVLISRVTHPLGIRALTDHSNQSLIESAEALCSRSQEI